MHGTFFQRVLLTAFFAVLAAGLIWFYKHVIQESDFEINQNWRSQPAATAHP